jgi:pyridinium-3,5-bisthiocarboxylic acid mononucleotide nickel chelatase
LTVLYFDCFSGASGDMILGALLDAGLPLDDLRGALGSLAIDRDAVWTERVNRAGITATKFQVRGENGGADGHNAHHHAHQHGQHYHPHRTLSQISTLIDGSALAVSGKERAKELFAKIGKAEAEIHGTSTDQVHLHEVGALDSIIDIVGTVYALDAMGVERVVSSPLNVGSGTVKSAHGVYPVPAPATVKLLRDAPIYAGPQASELVTPTGALLVTSYADSFGPVPPMRLSAVGYGAGMRDLPQTPNVLRVMIGTADAAAVPSHAVTVIEADIDDMNPQIFGALMDRLLAEGALDVFYTSIQMKKNRPGTLLTIIAAPEARERLTSLVFRETTTIGVRYREMTRECLDRETITVQTPLGPVRFKIARRNGEVLNVSPEFDDCARIAAATGTPIKDVQSAAMKSYLDQCAST